MKIIKFFKKETNSYGPGMCAHYIKHRNEWLDGGWDLMDARVGFDQSEPEGSPYRFGNGSCMHDIVQINGLF